MYMTDQPAGVIFPPDGNPKLWRYMDFAKLVALLEARALHFARVDQFQDPWEGFHSPAGVRQFRESARESNLSADVIERVIANLHRLRPDHYVNCWFTSEDESAAMWSLYLRGGDGVAIVTDHEALAAALEACPFAARTSLVRYVDYEVVPISFGSVFSPIVHKRRSFAHEAELRALIWGSESRNEHLIAPGATGIEVPIDPTQLIHTVHVAPTAPIWFRQLVERVLWRYGLKVPVVRSSLYDSPVF